MSKKEIVPIFSKKTMVKVYFSSLSRLSMERKTELYDWIHSLSDEHQKNIRDLRQDARDEDYWPGA